MSDLPERFKGREERQRLKELERIVEDRIKYVQEAADALREISETKLYRLDYKTFDEYCKAKWGFGQASGYRLIATKKTTDNAGSSIPQNEGSPDKPGSKLTGTNSSVNGDSSTAETPPKREPGDDTDHIEEESKKPDPVDSEGTKIPPQALLAFENAVRMEEWGRKVDALIRELKEIVDGAGGRLIDYETVRTHIKNGKMTVLQNRATHVCPMCNGRRMVEPCRCCGNEGWTCTHVYKRLTAEKAK